MNRLNLSQCHLSVYHYLVSCKRKDAGYTPKTQVTIGGWKLTPGTLSKLKRIGSKKTFSFLLLILCLSTINSAAQVLQPTEDSHHNLSFNAGFDNNLIGLNAGYAYYTARYKTSAFIDFAQGSSLIGTGDFRTQIGLQSWQGSSKKFTLKNSVAFVYVQSVNKAGNYKGLGLNLVVNPGLRFNRFGIGADLQYNPLLATHIKHTDYYRTQVYENVRDGWYGATAQNLRLGLYAAVQLGKKRTFELNLKGGNQNNGQYDKIAPNAYAIIGINKSF